MDFDGIRNERALIEDAIRAEQRRAEGRGFFGHRHWRNPSLEQRARHARAAQLVAEILS